MAPNDQLLSECLRQQKPSRDEEPEGPSWKDKPLHGMYHRQMKEVSDMEKTYQWMEKAGLKDSTEALLMAAQEQALNTRAIEAGVYHTRPDPRCRRCREEPETVQHITAGGRCWRQGLHGATEPGSGHSGQEHLDPGWTGGPRVQMGDTPKGDGQQTGPDSVGLPDPDPQMVMSNHPDIVVVDKHGKTAVVIDVAIPSDSNVRKKEHE